MIANKLDLISDENFKELVKNSTCSADILKELGYTVKGNSWGYRIIAERMDKLNITFGKKLVLNDTKVHRLDRLPLSKILTKDSSYNRTKLKQRLIEEGIKENKCEICGLTHWLNKPITIQLHHLNGLNNDNRLSNLQFLCPNCHSQTANFGSRGKGSILKRKYDSLPSSDIDTILNSVRKYGIVKARKILPYRNSLINSVVKNNQSIIIMTSPSGEEIEFSTMYEASKYLYEKCNIGKNIESSRTGISKCCSGKQQTIKGFKFRRRSISEENIS